LGTAAPETEGNDQEGRGDKGHTDEEAGGEENYRQKGSERKRVG
jgi:hypothetical protein